MSDQIFQSELLSGEPVQIGDVTVTPQSRVLAVRFPYGGFVWHRPAAVLVERNGRSQRIPIVDITRIIVLAAAGVAAAARRWLDLLPLSPLARMAFGSIPFWTPPNLALLLQRPSALCSWLGAKCAASAIQARCNIEQISVKSTGLVGRFSWPVFR